MDRECLAGSALDFGNMVNTDACTNVCKAAKCGDAIIQAGVEECDDGNQVDNDACSNSCKAPKCGDAIVQPGEDCDLGVNNGPNAQCTLACKWNYWSDNFDVGAPFKAEWVMSGNLPWTISNVTPQAGPWNARSGAIGNSQQSNMEVKLNFTQAGSVTFWRRVSSEANFDYLRFFIDGVQQGQWSGTVAWGSQTYPVAAGLRTLRWQYIKDGSLSSGEDAAYVDTISTVWGFKP